MLSRASVLRFHVIPRRLGMFTQLSSSSRLDDKKEVAPVVEVSTVFKEPPVGQGFNRWSTLVPAVACEMSIGAIYCWTMWCPAITTLSGVVVAAPSDFTLGQVVPILSVAAIGLGIATPIVGKKMEEIGPKRATTIGAISWFTGLMTCSAAAHFQSLPLLYLGYSGMGGAAWGLLYMAPVTATMKWFPDKRGLATGITLSAFGAGAAIAPPLIDFFTSMYFVAPDFLGTVAETAITTLSDGSQVLTSDMKTAVVVATDAAAAKVGLGGGVYAIGTGNSGASGAFASLACIYGTVGGVASQYIRGPPEGWLPDGYVVDQTSTAGTLIGVKMEDAVRTSQFPLLWMTIFGNAVGGLALISSSKMIMVDVWSGAMPGVVTASFATGYVAALGTANAAGRLGWAVASDKIGRKNTYSTFALSIPFVAGVPFLVASAMELGGASVAPLAVFVGGSLFVISNYGGIFSVLPAYIADLYGQKHASSIHGMALTAWCASAFCGPMGLTQLRGHAERTAIDGLLLDIDPTKFETAFGASLEQRDALYESKTMTISRLMEIVPEGVPDPTPHLYDTTFMIAAGFLGVAGICNQLLKPPDVHGLLKIRKEKDAAALEVTYKDKQFEENKL